MSDVDEALRQHVIGMIKEMGYIVVPPAIYEQARSLLPEVADKIIKSEKLPQG